MSFKYLLSGFFVLTMAGCSMIPEQIQTADESILVSYNDAKSAPYVHQSMTARWGGVIAEVNNLKDSTVIEVVNIDLGAGAKPKGENKSAGRFRAIKKGFIDPVIFKQGKQITVVGKIAEPQKGKIGELEYLFPVIEIDGLQLWKEVKEVDVRLHNDPYMRHYDPFFRYPYHYPASRTVIIKKQPQNSNSHSKDK